MLAGVTCLLVFQCIGEVLVRLTRVPVPGPVVGMVLSESSAFRRSFRLRQPVCDSPKVAFFELVT